MVPSPPKGEQRVPRVRPQQEESLFPLIGKKRVAFLQSAEKLDKLLKGTYGSEMTITKFEKILVEIKGRPELKDKLHLEDETLVAHCQYVDSKREANEELALFRQAFRAPPVPSVPEVSKVEDLFSLE